MSRTQQEQLLYCTTENDIPKAVRTELNALINQRLADVIDLQMQLKQAHWNVKGPHFIGLHELFDKSAEEVETYVSEIAERAVQLEVGINTAPEYTNWGGEFVDDAFRFGEQPFQLSDDWPVGAVRTRR